jgi:hypothetical protein
MNFWFVSGKTFFRIPDEYLVSLMKATSEVNIMLDSPFSDIAIVVWMRDLDFDTVGLGCL